MCTPHTPLESLSTCSGILSIQCGLCQGYLCKRERGTMVCIKTSRCDTNEGAKSKGPQLQSYTHGGGGIKRLFNDLHLNERDGVYALEMYNKDALREVTCER